MADAPVSEPTVEQMERTAVALGFGSILHARRAPHYEGALRNLHALVQKAVLGDEQANKSLAALKSAFGETRDV